MENSTLVALLEFVWIPIVLGLITLWTRMTTLFGRNKDQIGVLDTRASLLEQAEKHYQQQRTEDRETQEKRFSMVMAKFDALDERIKNGH